MNENQKLGTIMKELIRFSLPLILSGVLQQLYNWADAFIVGNVDGELLQHTAEDQRQAEPYQLFHDGS